MNAGLAWAVHALTLSGAGVGVWTLSQIASGNDRGALLGMVLAVLIDGVDGTLARRARVADVLPDYDGRQLDWVVDWTNFVLVPAFWVGFAPVPLVPPQLVWPTVAAMLASAGYHFGNRNAVDRRGNFRGFPAMWSLVVFWLVVSGTGPALAGGIIAAVTLLHFVPVRFVYPSRAQRGKVAVWTASALVILSAGALAWLYPHRSVGALLCAAVGFGLLGLESFRQTLRSGVDR